MTSNCLGLPGVRTTPRAFKYCIANDRSKLRRYYREACLEMAGVLFGRLYVSRQMLPGDNQMVDLAGRLRSDAKQCAPLCRAAQLFEVDPALIRAIEGLARLSEVEADIYFAAGALQAEASLPQTGIRSSNGT